MENLIFNGGCAFIVTNSTEKPVFCANRCVFKDARSGSSFGNGLSIKGEVKVRIFDCISINNYHDGFNYHKNTDITPVSGAPNVLEVNCAAYGNGSTHAKPTTENGSSAHNYTVIIRVNGRYHNNHGGNIADIGHAISWNVGCMAYESEQTVDDVNNADYLAESYTGMYCDNCVAGGSEYDGWHRIDSHIHVAGDGISVFNAVDPQEDASAHDTYLSEAVYKYRVDQATTQT